MLNRTSTIRLIKISGILVLILLIVSYAIWRSMDYIRGPKIEISEPTNGTGITASTTTIVGRTERVNDLLLNGKSITINEQGNFRETLIIFQGVNFLTFRAHDRFGRKISKQLQLVGI